jgi:biotin transporter BioY
MAAISREKILAFAVAAFLLTTYINASWHTWQFGASFGHRGFIGTLPFMAAGLAWLSAGCRTPLRVKFFLGFGSLLALFNIWLCILYSVNTIDRNGPVLPADIVAGSAEFMRLAVGIIK